MYQAFVKEIHLFSDSISNKVVCKRSNRTMAKKFILPSFGTGENKILCTIKQRILL